MQENTSNTCVSWSKAILASLHTNPAAHLCSKLTICSKVYITDPSISDPAHPLHDDVEHILCACVESSPVSLYQCAVALRREGEKWSPRIDGSANKKQPCWFVWSDSNGIPTAANRRPHTEGGRLHWWLCMFYSGLTLISEFLPHTAYICICEIHKLHRYTIFIYTHGHSKQIIWGQETDGYTMCTPSITQKPTTWKKRHMRNVGERENEENRIWKMKMKKAENKSKRRQEKEN